MITHWAWSLVQGAGHESRWLANESTGLTIGPAGWPCVLWAGQMAMVLVTGPLWPLVHVAGKEVHEGLPSSHWGLATSPGG